MKKGGRDANLVDVKRIMEERYGKAEVTEIFKKRDYPDYSGFEEPLPDIVGYKQHAAECASDAIQEVLMFADSIREFTQPILYNITEQQMDVRSKLTLQYNDWETFNEYFKYVQKRFRSHYDVINYLRTHKIKAHKYQTDYDKVCALDPLFYRKRAHSAEGGILALKKLKRETVYSASGYPISQIPGTLDKIFKWLHIPFERKLRRDINVKKSVGITISLSYGFVKPDHSIYWKTTGHATACIKMTGQWYYYDNNEGFTRINEALVTEMLNPASQIWIIKYLKTYIVKGGERPTHVWKDDRWDPNITAFTDNVGGLRKYKDKTYLYKTNYDLNERFISIEPTADIVPYNYKNCKFEGGRATSTESAITTVKSILECIYSNDVSNSYIFEDLYHYMYENLDYISTDADIYASLVSTLPTIGVRPACTPMIHYWVFQIQAHIKGLVRDKYSWFEVPPLKTIRQQIAERETPPAEREAKAKASEEYKRKQELLNQGIDPDKVVKPKLTPCPKNKVRDPVTKECIDRTLPAEAKDELKAAYNELQKQKELLLKNNVTHPAEIQEAIKKLEDEFKEKKTEIEESHSLPAEAKEEIKAARNELEKQKEILLMNVANKSIPPADIQEAIKKLEQAFVEKKDEIKAAIPCPEGEYRDPKTKKCRKTRKVPSKRKTPVKLTPCPPGQKRDPKTRKCIERLEKLTPCPPGQTRDPKTKKCRTLKKVKLHD